MVVTIYFDNATGRTPKGIILQIGQESEKLDYKAVARLKRMIETYERLRHEHERPARHGDRDD